jgi:hypothetical protein
MRLEDNSGGWMWTACSNISSSGKPCTFTFTIKFASKECTSPVLRSQLQTSFLLLLMYTKWWQTHPDHFGSLTSGCKLQGKDKGVPGGNGLTLRGVSGGPEGYTLHHAAAYASIWHRTNHTQQATQQYNKTRG